MNIKMHNLTPGTIIETSFGRFVVDTFIPGALEIIVLRTEDIPGKVDNILCRIQSECIRHVFFDRSCDCSEQMSASLKLIQENKTGLLIYLRQEGCGLGTSGTLMKDKRDWRSYDSVVDILSNYYGIKSVELISLNKRKKESLINGNIQIAKHRWYGGTEIELGDKIERTIDGIREGNSYRPVDSKEKPKVLILGDLNIDYYHWWTKQKTKKSVGGTAYNAAIAIKNQAKFTPIIFGKVGRDEGGREIREKLQEQQIYFFFGIHDTKSTGLVNVTPTGDYRASWQYRWDKKNNANDYDVRNLGQAIMLADLGEHDYAFVSSYLFVQTMFDKDAIKKILKKLADSGVRLILDLVRKSIAPDVLDDCEFGGEFTKETLQDYLKEISLYALIADMGTFNRLGFNVHTIPEKVCFEEWFTAFYTKWIICRYEEQNHHRRCQGYARRTGKEVMKFTDEWKVHEKDIELGLTDKWFAEALEKMKAFELSNNL